MKLSIGKIKEKNNSGIREIQITLEADLVVKNTKKIKEELMGILPKGDAFYISSKELFAIDLSGLQLLAALSTHAQSLGKKLSVDLSLSPEVNTILEHVGFTTILNQYKN